jgi:hypothetical protein
MVSKIDPSICDYCPEVVQYTLKHSIGIKAKQIKAKKTLLLVMSLVVPYSLPDLNDYYKRNRFSSGAAHPTWSFLTSHAVLLTIPPDCCTSHDPSCPALTYLEVFLCPTGPPSSYSAPIHGSALDALPPTVFLLRFEVNDGIPKEPIACLIAGKYAVNSKRVAGMQEIT